MAPDQDHDIVYCRVMVLNERHGAIFTVLIGNRFGKYGIGSLIHFISDVKSAYSSRVRAGKVITSVHEVEEREEREEEERRISRWREGQLKDYSFLRNSSRRGREKGRLGVLMAIAGEDHSSPLRKGADLNKEVM